MPVPGTAPHARHADEIEAGTGVYQPGIGAQRQCQAGMSVIAVIVPLVKPNIEGAERPRRAMGELAHAVIDGPDGIHAVELSPLRAEALRLKENSFWCSRQAGGCGGVLVLAAGPIRVPYFRHLSSGACALAGDNARAARSYEHLRYQRALLAWLEAQNLSATMEHHLGPDGRADLHVLVCSRSHTIEVQLSPIGTKDWRRRDDGYRRQVDQVTWLYGPGAETAAAAEQAARGHALHIRARAGTSSAIEIGVVTDLTEEWSFLGECELRPDGFWTPHLEQALADVAAAAEEARREALRQTAEDARREALRQAAARRAAERNRQSRHHSAPPSGDLSREYGTLSWWRTMHPEHASWASQQRWAWTDDLTAKGKAAAQMVAYIVSRLYTSGPIDKLMVPDEVTGAEVLAALERAGFLRLYEIDGIARWQRT